MWAGFSGFSGSLIRYNLLICLPPLADLTGSSELGPCGSAPCSQPPEAFTPELAAESVTLLAVGYTTVAPGGFHWQVSHLLVLQLASLHDRRPCLSMMHGRLRPRHLMSFDSDSAIARGVVQGTD
jgi:hypothetical protein